MFFYIVPGFHVSLIIRLSWLTTLNLEPYGNDASYIQVVEVMHETVAFRGGIDRGRIGIEQIFIPDKDAIRIIEKIPFGE